MRAGRKILLSILVVIVIIILGAVTRVWTNFESIEESFKHDYALFRSIRIGTTEEQVRQILGKPDKIYHKSTAPKHYYVQGYSYRQREIGNRVLIYIRGEPIAYIYFDNQDRVEDVFVGGS